MLGSPHDAEDIVQDTLLRAWRALERFEPRASLRTWLYRIATNACLDEIERRPNRPEPVEPFPNDGMTVIGVGILWTTQAPVHGHFWANLFGAFLVAVGMGSAFAFIPVSIAALAGVAEHEAGLASGLIYTSQELGGALGIAIASSIAASHYKTLLRGGDSVHAALTGGFHSALHPQPQPAT